MTQEEQIQKIIDVFGRPALWVSLRSICAQPQHELRVETPFVDVSKTQSLDASMLGLSAFQPGSLAHTDRMRHFSCHNQKWRFLKVYDRRIVRHTQNQANDFIIYFLKQSIKMLKNISFNLINDDSLNAYFSEFQRIIKRLNGLLNEFLQEYPNRPLETIPIDNPLLQFEPRYHVILETWLACESI